MFKAALRLRAAPAFVLRHYQLQLPRLCAVHRYGCRPRGPHLRGLVAEPRHHDEVVSKFLKNDLALQLINEDTESVEPDQAQVMASINK
jgi:hypothetical protein